MTALRRTTWVDICESRLIHQVCLQASQAHQAGEISQEMQDAIIKVFHRCHTNLFIRTGTLARIRQKYFERRTKSLAPASLFDLFMGAILLLTVAAWIWLP